jgi:hypothetical protein
LGIFPGGGIVERVKLHSIFLQVCQTQSTFFFKFKSIFVAVNHGFVIDGLWKSVLARFHGLSGAVRNVQWPPFRTPNRQPHCNHDPP